MAVERSSRDLDWLNELRSHEFNKLTDLLPQDPEYKILEIGSGTGFLLNKFGNLYKSVYGIEVENSAYISDDTRISLYDGVNIPFEDNTFDVVFSCHVVEHVENLDLLNNEIKRILKDNGIIIHIAPSSTWRILTSIFHYFHLISLPFRIILKKDTSIGQRSKENFPSLLSKLGYVIMAPRHGLTGNRLTEIYYFSKRYWKDLFTSHGFSDIKVIESEIIYWGHDIFRFKFPMRYRKSMSKFIGSSSNIYIMNT